MVVVERAMADFPKNSSLGVSMDILKTNTLKTHTDPHTVRGRPTLKDVRFLIRSVGELHGLTLCKQHNLQNAVFYEDGFVEIHVSYVHLAYNRTRRLW